MKLPALRTKFLLSVVLAILFFVQACNHDESGIEKNISRPILDSLPAITNVSQFFGTQKNGLPFSDTSMKGKIWLVSFFFTSCGDICPKLNAVVDKLRNEFQSDSLRFLSITVDPETDTPNVLNEHAKRMKYEDSRWIFLRLQDEAMLKKTMDDFLIGSPAMPSNHSARIILVDASGTVRGFYDALDEKHQQNLKTILKSIQ